MVAPAKFILDMMAFLRMNYLFVVSPEHFSEDHAMLKRIEQMVTLDSSFQVLGGGELKKLCKNKALGKLR